MRFLMVSAFLVFAVIPQRAGAQSPEDEVRTFIANWYDELRKGDEARVYPLLASQGAVLPVSCPDQCGPQPRAMKIQKVPPFPHLLATRAQQFAYEIRHARVEQTLARVDVWERGWFWAWAAKTTYESAASASFYLENLNGSGWKIALYRSDSRAIHPKHKDDPLPDLSPKEP